MGAGRKAADVSNCLACEDRVSAWLLMLKRCSCALSLSMLFGGNITWHSRYKIQIIWTVYWYISIDVEARTKLNIKRWKYHKLFEHKLHRNLIVLPSPLFLKICLQCWIILKSPDDKATMLLKRTIPQTLPHVQRTIVSKAAYLSGRITNTVTWQGKGFFLTVRIFYVTMLKSRKL